MTTVDPIPPGPEPRSEAAEQAARGDIERLSLNVLVAVFEGMTSLERGRTLRYLYDRYGSNGG